MPYLSLPDHILEAIGVFGFGIYVLTYSLLTLRVLSSNSVRYFILNLTASSCVLIGLTASFNLAAALIQLFWVVMSVLGIVLRLTRPSHSALSEPGNRAPDGVQA